MSWEAVIGLEVHVQLRTGRKLFCRDAAVFGDPPNTHVCPVCLGLPGALPVPDPDAVSLAVRAALGLGCTVHRTSVWERKNYFYPDLPKGYQITQLERPLATDGCVVYPMDGEERTVRIRRVHMEEDAGKSLHDRWADRTAVDLNRAGTPLIEIVTEPDLRAPEEARSFLQELKLILEYLDVSDCNMEEGSLRADANVSVRRPGQALQTKTEIKNVNSFSYIEKAVRLEIDRQRVTREDGGRVEARTLLWDERAGELRAMRSKEESEDYRYFPDPDLPPLVLSEAELERLRARLPERPSARRERLRVEHGLTDYEADVLTRARATADYFEAVVAAGAEPRAASNWVLGAVLALLNRRGETLEAFPVRPPALAELLALIERGTVSGSAAKTVLEGMAETGGSATRVVEERGLAQVRDEGTLEAWVDEVLAAHPDEVGRYRSGEGKLLGFLVGQVMKRSGGRADPRRVSRLLGEKIGS